MLIRLATGCLHHCFRSSSISFFHQLQIQTNPNSYVMHDLVDVLRGLVIWREDELGRDDDVKRVPDLEDDRSWPDLDQGVVGRKVVPRHGEPDHDFALFKNSQRKFEPWSSGYGWRLAFWRLWVRIPAAYAGWTFDQSRRPKQHWVNFQFNLTLVALVMLLRYAFWSNFSCYCHTLHLYLFQNMGHYWIPNPRLIKISIGNV